MFRNEVKQIFLGFFDTTKEKNYYALVNNKIKKH